ncbi:sodium- and chloride-dependent betaine transporter-like [Haliotis rubra]|uniref:sodium- and chloride-dependent betaine transporter-like n=1 Tax=Haliotis rubra TaxID=36100 RepID=UPI001EE57F58|nr:sodium- and chloride-dependent betaine transporter-like [Haliotis rubra]
MKKCVRLSDGAQPRMSSMELCQRLLSITLVSGPPSPDVFSFELATVSPAFFHDDGSMRKCLDNVLAADMETLAMETADDADVQETPSTARGNWSNQLDYVVSVLGCIVGYGNLWRFPYICNRNGGGIGVGQFIACTGGLIYYQTIIAWSIYYMVMSCASVLPWSTCGNEWNTESCLEETLGNIAVNRTDGQPSNTNSIMNATRGSQFTFDHTDVGEFWQYKALGVSEGVQEIGQVQWHLVVCLFVLWIFVFASLIKGIKSAGKVAYVTVFLPYLLLVVLLIRTLLVPGAVDGIVFYLKPDLTRLLDLQVVHYLSLVRRWPVLI